MTSRALVAVLAVGAFSGCGDDTTSTTDDDGSTSAADPTTDDPTTDDPTTDDPTTDGGTDSGPTASTGEGTTTAEGSTGGSDETGAEGSTGSAEGSGSTGDEGSTSSDSAGSSGDSSSTGSSVKPFCGDGIVDADEECDEGLANANSADCTASCTVNVCGDGFQHALTEACDDGNADSTDDCVSCQAATCGDGFTHFGVEACDDGDADDLDSCRNDCSAHEVLDLSLGADFTCARFDSGNVKCWGHGASGRLGYGNLDSIGDDETPAAVDFIDLGEGAFVEAVSAGASHTCVSLSDGSARCWGAAGAGQLGYGNMIPLGDNEAVTSVDAIAFGDTVSAIGTGDGALHGCAALDGGDFKCWGQAANAKLGIVGQQTNIGDNEPLSASPVTDVGVGVQQIAAGSAHTCVRTATGTVRCWGTNASAALGYGNAEIVGDDETPATAGDVPLTDFVIDIAAGWNHNCAVLEGGDVQCWGRGNDGRLGYGDTLYVGFGQTPADKGVLSLDGPARQVAAGLAHSCAALDDGSVQCWGFGASGQLGYGNTDSIGDNELPSAVGVVPLEVEARGVWAGGNHTCIVTGTGSVRCWGEGTHGRLGYASQDDIGDDETPESDVQLLAD
ncbi:MAG: RCC1 domain-containing protein [Nannocystaceae bacterium]|nr:hypothetical protein [bacterium]